MGAIYGHPLFPAHTLSLPFAFLLCKQIILMKTMMKPKGSGVV